MYDLSLGVAPAKARYVAVEGDEESHRVIGSTFDHREERLCDRRDQVSERRSLVDFEPIELAIPMCQLSPAAARAKQALKTTNGVGRAFDRRRGRDSGL